MAEALSVIGTTKLPMNTAKNIKKQHSACQAAAKPQTTTENHKK